MEALGGFPGPYTQGRIAKEKSLTYGWSWDFIFILEECDKKVGNNEYIYFFCFIFIKKFRKQKETIDTE